MSHPEQQLISAVIRMADTATPMAAGVTEQWFVKYNAEWRWVEGYFNRTRKVPTAGLFKTKFPTLRLLPVDDVDWAVEEMRVHHAKQLMLKMVDTVISEIDKGKDVNLIVSGAAAGLVKMQSELDGGRYQADILKDWRATYGSAWTRQKLAAKSATNASGIPTGWPSLDAATGGYHAGDYWVVAARLGQGKTWYLIRTAVEALASGKTVQFHALEQSRTQLAMRYHPFLSRRYHDKTFRASDLTRGTRGYDTKEYKTFLQGLDGKVPGTLIVDDTPRGKLTVLSLAAQIERNQPDLLIIDYLTLMATKGSDWQAIGELSADIKGLTADYGVATIVASQLNRDAQLNKNAGPEHLARSDAIGQDADGIVVLRKESRHVMRAGLVKYRHGEDLLPWWNEFRPNDGIFEEISRDDADNIKEQDEDEADG